MAQPEAALQKRMAQELRLLGFLVVRMRLLGVTGFPDLYALKDGKPYHIEVKMPGKKPSKLQEWWLERLASHGAITGWCATVEGALEICGMKS